MKFLLVCASLLVASNALDKEFVEKFIELLEEVGAKCIPEVNASDDDVAKLISHQIPDTHEGQCLLFCFHRDFNIQKSDGAFNEEGGKKFLEPLKAADADLHEQFVTILTKCMKSVAEDADPCVTAAKFTECNMKEGKEMGVKGDLFDM